MLLLLLLLLLLLYLDIFGCSQPIFSIADSTVVLSDSSEVKRAAGTRRQDHTSGGQLPVSAIEPPILRLCLLHGVVYSTSANTGISIAFKTH